MPRMGFGVPPVSRLLTEIEIRRHQARVTGSASSPRGRLFRAPERNQRASPAPWRTWPRRLHSAPTASAATRDCAPSSPFSSPFVASPLLRRSIPHGHGSAHKQPPFCVSPRTRHAPLGARLSAAPPSLRLAAVRSTNSRRRRHSRSGPRPILTRRSANVAAATSPTRCDAACRRGYLCSRRASTAETDCQVSSWRPSTRGLTSVRNHQSPDGHLT
jgi:hypothetical protein